MRQLSTRAPFLNTIEASSHYLTETLETDTRACASPAHPNPKTP